MARTLWVHAAPTAPRPHRWRKQRRTRTAETRWRKLGYQRKYHDHGRRRIRRPEHDPRSHAFEFHALGLAAFGVHLYGLRRWCVLPPRHRIAARHASKHRRWPSMGAPLHGRADCADRKGVVAGKKDE